MILNSALRTNMEFCRMFEKEFTYLAEKYNLPVPRYTSYPTVPVWKEGLDPGRWKSLFIEQFRERNPREGISLYIHLPFCESLCTYCGCNKKITTNHSVEEEYLEMIEREYELYLSELPARPVIHELHLGGGTPTFFSPGNLARLINFIKDHSYIHPDYEFSIEGHPNNTTLSHLQTLFDLGFRRISYGVQDNDPAVQKIINRLQPLENVKRVTQEARSVGFKSVNYDLIYGLPNQTVQSITRTFQEVLELNPDRIAFYSYAHVPWTSRGQRLFDENDLPSPEEKMSMYLKGKELLLGAGYVDIGMDHFALPADELCIAWKNGSLHRNFMGYTTQKTSILLGLGVSSISDIGNAFAQNKKSLHEYYESVRRGNLPTFRGYFLSEEDLHFRKYILDISCRGTTSFSPGDQELLKKYTFPELEKLEADGLVSCKDQELVVTDTGRQFIRNICSAFDLYIQRNREQASNSHFSKGI